MSATVDINILSDKFNIINDDVKDIPQSNLSSLLDNYFENLLYSNERIIHSDLLSQISWFRKDFDPSEIIIKHLENFLKQKKSIIRTNIKKGVFEIDSGLNKLIQGYCEKITIFSTHLNQKEKIIKTGLTKLFEQIISDPSLISYLKSELSLLKIENKKDVNILINVMKKINNINPDLKSYQWFLFMIASSLTTVIDETNNKSYPVPENFQLIINFRDNLDFYKKVEEYYSFVDKDINIIISGFINVVFKNLISIMKTCSIKEFFSLIKNYNSILEKLFSLNNINYEGKPLKEAFTVNYLLFIDNCNYKEQLGDFIKCFEVVSNLLNPTGTSRDIINNKISQLFSNEISQNYLLDMINQQLLSSNTNETSYRDILNFLSNIKDKDKFIEKYNSLMISRLLFSPNIDAERNIYTVLENKFGERLLNKTNKILTDMEYSMKDQENFKELFLNSNKLHVITSSCGNWDINQNEGILSNELITQSKDESALMYYLSKYNTFYQKRYQDKRKLNWSPHFGEITFDYLNKEFKMMPIQFIVIEFINKMKSSKETILNANILSGYNEDFRKSIVSSLLFGGILKQENDIITLNSDIDKMSTNYVDIFFSTTNYTDIWNKRREVELQMTREDVLSSWINHFVKKVSCDIVELYDKIKAQLTLFEFDKKLLEKVVTSMIEKDYIKYNSENKLEKLLW